MDPKKEIKTYKLGSGLLNAYILESGNLKEIRDNYNRINTYVGNNLESTVSNIYLKVFDGTLYHYTRLMGIGSNSCFEVSDDCVNYQGSFMGIDYKVLMKVVDDVILFDVVVLKSDKDYKCWLYYGMDISIGNVGGINSNEAYISQYIDHKVYMTDLGYVMCSRQNQGEHLYVEMGSLKKNISYATDGFQFFGKIFKFNKIPYGITKDTLPCEVYQYEFAYCALQSEIFNSLNGYHNTFYLAYSRKHDDPITSPLYLEHVKECAKDLDKKDIKVNNAVVNKQLSLNVNFSDIVNGLPLSNEELNQFYPTQTLKEVIDGNLVSFFTEKYAHVVLSQKELYLERPSGNIINSLTKCGDAFDYEHVLASTTYIYGLFNSQIVFGNTSYNKLMSNLRNPLNIQSISGQRIFIKLGGKYQILSMPSSYEMGLNYARWIYKLDNDTIVIKTTMSTKHPSVQMSFTSLNNINYDVLVTNHITMGQTENEQLVHIKLENGFIRYDFDHNTFTHLKCPSIYFLSKVSEDYELVDDGFFYEDKQSRNENLLCFKLNSKHFDVTFYGVDEELESKVYEVNSDEDECYVNEINSLVNNFECHIDSSKKSVKDSIESYNYLVHWFTHDALVHYLTPHGLEQYNGAAWGTRDVCQGPLELFLSLQHYDEVRRILLNVFKHQFANTWDFPQWFMFDKYHCVQDLSSHGDVIVWPARALGLYLKATNDLSILDECIPYMSRETYTYTKELYPLIEHIKHEIEYIENHFIKGTHLSCYGGGDWDDTLQPANKALKEKMVSGWTPELTYEMYNLLSNALHTYDPIFANHLKQLAEKTYKDYQEFMIKDNIPTGFAIFDNEKVKYILHPLDNESSLKYRLLPLTRGIISGMLNDLQITKAVNIIDEYLLCPDGVRLMDKSIKYRGGINTYFSRAETASNFGREIGLQYCHAHIRYCEALTKLNDPNVFNELMKINPVLITEVVKNALPRQRNSYFSSSDGDFLNRYEVMKNFNSLKDGSVKVKGGWRVYSSGSGIYMHTLISGMFGIKIIGNKLCLNPVLCNELDGLTLKTKILGKDVKITYHVGNTEVKVFGNGKLLNLSLLHTNNQLEGYVVNDLDNVDTLDIYC